MVSSYAPPLQEHRTPRVLMVHQNQELLDQFAHARFDLDSDQLLATRVQLDHARRVHLLIVHREGLHHLEALQKHPAL